MKLTRIAQAPELSDFQLLGTRRSFGGFVYVWENVDQARYEHYVEDNGEAVNEWYANDLAYEIYIKETKL